MCYLVWCLKWRFFFQDLAGISHLKPVISELANHVNVLGSGIT